MNKWVMNFCRVLFLIQMYNEYFSYAIALGYYLKIKYVNPQRKINIFLLKANNGKLLIHQKFHLLIDLGNS